MKFARAAGDTCMISQNFTFVHVKVRALTKHARSEADALVSPRAGKKKKTGSPRSAVKLSDGGPSRGHDVNGPAHGMAAVSMGIIPPHEVSPAVKVKNKIESAARTHVWMRRAARARV